MPWIFLVAVLARLFNLTYHSLWYDEVVSTLWAARPAAEVWQVGLALVADKHPPLYYLMLGGWTALVGRGDAAVRALGVFVGALAVLPACGIGRRLGDRRAGHVAALLVALNPFLVWYSQEARMFMPATTFLLLGLYGVLRLFDGLPAPAVSGAGAAARRVSRPVQGILWPALLVVVGFTSALYTYLFSAFMLPVAASWLLLLWWLNRRRPGAHTRLAGGVLALGTVTLLFLPLARSAWLVSGQESVPGRAFEGWIDSLWRLGKAFALGWTRWPAGLENALTMAAGALVLFGVLVSVAGWQRQRVSQGEDQRADAGATRWAGGLLLALWLALPALLGGLLLTKDREVFAETRYFTFMVPALCVGAGLGVAWLWRWRRLAGVAALTLVVGVTVAALTFNWTSENRREAWREAAGYVADHAGPSEAVLVYVDYVHPAFDRYFRGPQPIFFPLTGSVDDLDVLNEQLDGLVGAGFDAIWLVQSHHQGLDPEDQIGRWFGARFPLMTEQYPPGIAIRAFSTRYRTPALPPAVPQGTGAGILGPLTLLSCVADPGPVAAQDDLFHPPSGWVHVSTYWTAPEPVAADLFPSVRLVDDAGQVWGAHLERPGAAFQLWPTSRWVPGEVVRADFDVNLNPITPPGTYRLEVEVPGTGSKVRCGEIDVQ